MLYVVGEIGVEFGTYVGTGITHVRRLFGVGLQIEQFGFDGLVPIAVPQDVPGPATPRLAVLIEFVDPDFILVLIKEIRIGGEGGRLVPVRLERTCQYWPFGRGA